MQVTTFAATVENGKIRLPDNLFLPEKTKVFVVVPSLEVQPKVYLRSPRLAHPEQAVDFVKEVIEEDADASL